MIADSNYYWELSMNFSGLAVFAAGLLFFQLCPIPITGKTGEQQMEQQKGTLEHFRDCLGTFGSKTKSLQTRATAVFTGFSVVEMIGIEPTTS